MAAGLVTVHRLTKGYIVEIVDDARYSADVSNERHAAESLTRVFDVITEAFSK